MREDRNERASMRFTGSKQYNYSSMAQELDGPSLFGAVSMGLCKHREANPTYAVELETPARLANNRLTVCR